MGRRPTGISAKQTPADSRLAGVCLCCTNFTLPTGALDSKSSAQVMKRFSDIHKTGQTILVVTHSVKTASYAERVLFIRDGQLFNQLYRGKMENEVFREKISDNLAVLLQKEGFDA